MTFQQYQDYFDAILNTSEPQPPYDNESYLQYAKLNGSRSQRWLKQNPLTEATKKIVTAIAQKQQWVVITEPWCGDAAHIVPILYLMSQLNDKIDFKLQLRDTDSEIEQYLTHGTRSIPILVVRDEKGTDLFHWGPRPAAAKKVYEELKEQQADFEAAKIALQQVYNADKSLGIQEEVSRLLLEHSKN
ncbi:MAG: thioredoxin family protein [Niabella sp.]|nr:thioredoxin family protein [Niabella sp.]